MFLPLFVELLLDDGEPRFNFGNGIALGGEIASDGNRGRDQIRLEAALAFFEIVRRGPDEFAFLVFDLTDLAWLRARLPPDVSDKIAVVMSIAL